MSHDHNHDHEERELITLVDAEQGMKLCLKFFDHRWKEEFGKTMFC